MIKQFVPQEYCLKCKGCCRFKEADSAWSPCLLDEEIQDLLDKNIPAVYISGTRKIMPVSNPKEEGFVCPFLGMQDNKCRIYELRPFECQLYPFLINLRNKKVILSVDLNCPYIYEKTGTREFKDYLDHLGAYLNSPKQLKVLKDNPQIIQAYEEVSEAVELRIPDETP